nr:hypothetical protein [Tanacetum cinerariifolium]
MTKQDMYSPFGKMWFLTDKDVFYEEFMMESEVFNLLKISDDFFTYDSPLGIFFNEFKRLSSMQDDLFSYEIGITEDFYFLCIEQPHDNLKNDDLDIYEPRVCYDENEKIYAEAMILINKKLGLKHMKNIRTRGYMNGTRKYNGLRKNHGWNMGFRKSILMILIMFVECSILKLDTLNGPLVIIRKMDITMEENYQESFE